MLSRSRFQLAEDRAKLALNGAWGTRAPTKFGGRDVRIEAAPTLDEEKGVKIAWTTSGGSPAAANAKTPVLADATPTIGDVAGLLAMERVEAEKLRERLAKVTEEYKAATEYTEHLEEEHQTALKRIDAFSKSISGLKEKCKEAHEKLSAAEAAKEDDRRELATLRAELHAAHTKGVDEAKLRMAERRASGAEELLAVAEKQKERAERLLQKARERLLQSEKEVGRLQDEKVALEMEVAGRPATVGDVGALQREVAELRSQLAIARAASVRSEKGLEDLRKLLPSMSREASAASEVSLIHVRDTKTQEERVADAMADKKSKYDCVWATSFPERFDMHGYEAMVENTTKLFDLGRYADVATAVKEIVKVLLPTRSIESTFVPMPPTVNGVLRATLLTVLFNLKWNVEREVRPVRRRRSEMW